MEVTVFLANCNGSCCTQKVKERFEFARLWLCSAGEEDNWKVVLKWWQLSVANGVGWGRLQKIDGGSETDKRKPIGLRAVPV
ncbi:Hypothetical predicted protein [Olea europaea subsp. europaea]|uniref:Uncharacterized protein n=1 Tax=Olea europaea subsp. europaea TaxID=158383 RepID=A0A8S0UG45_OLEEU|nr:Hypothetical predicted protein [Olea europaea subsp. europaea]